MSQHAQDPDHGRSHEFADGFSHNLTPLSPFDIRKADSAANLLEELKHCAFGGRSLGEAADVLQEMVEDPKCFVVGTFTGAMTIAKMGLLLTEMLDQGMLNAVVSTGALICHGMVEQTGHTHFKYDPRMNDSELYAAGYARVYDTLELEKNLNDIDQVMTQLLPKFAGQPFSSQELGAEIGRWLVEQAPDSRGILQSAHRQGVPVYIPAFSDSELGIDVLTYNRIAALDGRPQVLVDGMRDLEHYYDQVERAETLGIFTIGGGVPRNWAQQAGPLSEMLELRSGGRLGGALKFRYALRICPEPVHWGGLSGCTYSEGVSWGKFIPAADGGRHAEVYADATIAWPILVRAVLERMGRV